MNRDLRVYGQVVVDKSANLYVNDAVIRGNLRVHGTIISVDSVSSAATSEKPIEKLLTSTIDRFFCELTMDIDAVFTDNQCFKWILPNDLSSLKHEITVPVEGLYSINVRVYNVGPEQDDDVTAFTHGSGISFWINDIYTYASALSTQTDCTHTLSITRPLKANDKLSVQSILTNKIICNNQQLYTFQVAQI